MKLIQDILVSRKAQSLLLLVLLVLLGGQAGLSPEQVTLTAEGLMAYIIGRAIHDNGLSKS
ncbi:MAG TPA: hypothetical protein EYO59_12150 [Chromatiaceae bacterium]|jgi:hypothetical protein|nr:hypothetical protein [Chromatiaceae bacterium]